MTEHFIYSKSKWRDLSKCRRNYGSLNESWAQRSSILLKPSVLSTPNVEVPRLPGSLCWDCLGVDFIMWVVLRCKWWKHCWRKLIATGSLLMWVGRVLKFLNRWPIASEDLPWQDFIQLNPDRGVFKYYISTFLKILTPSCISKISNCLDPLSPSTLLI